MLDLKAFHVGCLLYLDEIVQLTTAHSIPRAVTMYKPMFFHEKSPPINPQPITGVFSRHI